MTTQIVIITGAFFGMLSVIFGAFGAHALKKILTKEQLHSFEVGVKYQMYHAILLLVLGFNSNSVNSSIYWCFALGQIVKKKIK